MAKKKKKKNSLLRISVTALKPFQINLQFKNRVLAIQTQLQGKLLFPPHSNSSPSTTYIQIVRLPLLKAQVRISITGSGWVRSAVTRKMFRTRHMGEPERDGVTSKGGTKTCSQEQEERTVTKIRTQGPSQADSCG